MIQNLVQAIQPSIPINRTFIQWLEYLKIQPKVQYNSVGRKSYRYSGKCTTPFNIK